MKPSCSEKGDKVHVDGSKLMSVKTKHGFFIILPNLATFLSGRINGSLCGRIYTIARATSFNHGQNASRPMNQWTDCAFGRPSMKGVEEALSDAKLDQV